MTNQASRHDFQRDRTSRWMRPAIFGLSAALSVSAAAMYSPARVYAFDDTQALAWAARTCYLEASFSEPDCVALLWVARKKAARLERPWFEVLHQYSSIHTNTPRAKEVSAYPWGDVPGKNERFNRRWEQLRQVVLEFANGDRNDPCPHAEHWGGSMDHPQGRMIPARCAVSTANTFYAIKARRSLR